MHALIVRNASMRHAKISRVRLGLEITFIGISHGRGQKSRGYQVRQVVTVAMTWYLFSLDLSLIQVTLPGSQRVYLGH